ncbi:ATP-binding protein [Microbacterium lacus]|uniref:ATP-binding protein n=1 Tax=Microbacterium lacus TaxID=415217 RepID=UPI001E520D30|nr:ATP-binding protein [Microbacterium lacus]
MTSDAALARRSRIHDSVRERTVLQNQVLLASIVLLGALVIIAFGQAGDIDALVLGMVVVFAATGAALVVPWNRFPPIVAAVIPAADIVAIAILRYASPESGLGLLWAFPAMWIAYMYGLIGTVLAVTSVSALFWVLLAISPSNVLTATTLLLPVSVAAVATIAYLASRRSWAQRELLDKQTRNLERSVERARRQEDIVTDALDAVDFGVIRISPDGSLAVTNEAHARLQRARSKGAEAAAFGADGVTRMLADEMPLARARAGELFENELVWYGEPGDDSRRALSMTARRIQDVNGQDAGTIVISRDVTTEELALRAREDLVASVSHELRTPLTSIIGYLDLALDEDSLAPTARRSLEVAERNATRLLELVSDILTVSAASRQGVDLTVTPQMSDLAEVVMASIEAVIPPAGERRITIDASGVEPAMAYADPHRIRQVMDNLLSNAVKYNDDGGHIEVGLTSDGLHAWIIVRDDGPGISEQELPRLFERFFRADAVRKTTTHGSGLGLAITRDIVRASGGEITVQTRAGEGATFIVRLPATDPRGEA